MLAINHALTGAILGLSIANPEIAIPAAFASHFLLDAIPHFDPPGDESERLGAYRFKVQLVVDAVLCLLLVVGLAVTHPRHWLTAAFSAFAATSPDLFWIPKFVHAQRMGETLQNTNFFWKFHSWVQWHTSPRLLRLEAAWFIGSVTILVLKIR